MSKLYDEVMSGKSVRTFDGRLLSEDDLGKIEQYIRDVPNPFGIPVTFALLDAKQHGLSSPVIAGESPTLPRRWRRDQMRRWPTAIPSRGL